MVKTVMLDKKEYVILPKAEFSRLIHGKGHRLDGAVQALPFAESAIARDLKLAREEASLTQAELGRRLKKSQAMVSSAEAGRIRVGARYVGAVLRACGLPREWRPTIRHSRAKA